MALAILELLAFEGANVRFNIDTGSNRYYQLKIGRSVERRYGIDWVDDVVFSTPIATNEAGGGLLNSSRDISIPARQLEPGHAYAQLFTFKNPQGKSPAFSSVLKVPVGSGHLGDASVGFAPSFSMLTEMITTDQFNAAQMVPCRTCREAYSRPASLEDLLAGIVKVAAPAVLNLLAGGQNGGRPTAASGVGAGATGNGAQLDALATLLKTILGSIPGITGANVSKPQSLLSPSVNENRFVYMQSSDFSQPFNFGISEITQLVAALAPLIKPIAEIIPGVVKPIAESNPQLLKEGNQTLPLMLNAINQGRLEMKQANNKLVSDLVSDLNRRLLLEQLERQAPPGEQPDNGVVLSQLLQLLQQASPAAATTSASAPTPTVALPGPGTATAKSFSLNGGDSSILSSKAVVSFVSAAPISWNGTPKILFARNQGVQMKVELKVAEPAPKTALPKVILRIVFQDAADQSVRFEKIFKQKDVLANSAIPIAFKQDELAHLPANKVISVLGEMRWLTKSGRQYKALGSTEIVLVNKYFLKEQGKDVSAEQELTDMKQFRPFWNKVWEAPSLDAAADRSDSEKKYLWELDVNAKYSVLLSADHEANGLMQTKLLRGKPDAESLSEKVEGRMKAGIELSIAELNKLIPLWKGETALDREKLEALQTTDFAKNNAGEFMYNFKLKGRAGERGMVWVVPIFKLFECTLSTVSKNGDTGQVTAMTDEKVRFPLPVSARVIGLKSQQ